MLITDVLLLSSATETTGDLEERVIIGYRREAKSVNSSVSGPPKVMSMFKNHDYIFICFKKKEADLIFILVLRNHRGK